MMYMCVAICYRLVMPPSGAESEISVVSAHVSVCCELVVCPIKFLREGGLWASDLCIFIVQCSGMLCVCAVLLVCAAVLF